jgi:SAM-dependent methyltransferase
VNIHARGRLIGWEDRRFDRNLGIESEDDGERSTATVGDTGAGFRYTGTPVRLAHSIFRALPGPAGYAFVDLGSGKGRMLALAALRGYDPVIGVEFARELHEIAVKNAHATQSRGVRFTPMLGDAGGFSFPSEPLVVYLNNPFSEVVMTRVIENLTRSYAEHPRSIVVAYQQLRREDDPTSNLQLLEDVPFLQSRPAKLTGFANHFLLAPFTVQLFESFDAAPGSSTAG